MKLCSGKTGTPEVPSSLCHTHDHNPMTTQNHDSRCLTCGSHLPHQRCPTCGSRLREPNLYCPVLKCDTKQPHENDPNVKLLMQKFAAPDRCLAWVKERDRKSTRLNS